MGMFFGIIFLALSSIFTWQLYNLGLNVETSETGVMEDYVSNIRAKGFFTGGDVNSFAGFMVVYIGYILTMIEKKQFSKKYYIVFALALIAILISASRTALGALAVIGILYFFRNLRQNKSYAIIFILLIVGFLFYDQFLLFLDRFSNVDFATQTNVASQGTRIWKWNIYLQYMMGNPDAFLYGNPTEIDFYRAAHNYFVIPLILVLIFHTRMLLIAVHNRKKINAFYIIIPYLMTIFMVNSSGSNQYLLLMLPIMENLQGDQQ